MTPDPRVVARLDADMVELCGALDPVYGRQGRLHARLVRRSLERGFYQGGNLHPAQLPSRSSAISGNVESTPAPIV